jgi:hypothetical protein
MRRAVNVLVKAGLPTLAILFGGAGSVPRAVEEHVYRKHVATSVHAQEIATQEGMRWSILTTT